MIEDRDWEKIGYGSSRLKVPGGWFVLLYVGGSAKSGFFYPDPGHIWDGSALDPQREEAAPPPSYIPPQALAPIPPKTESEERKETTESPKPYKDNVVQHVIPALRITDYEESTDFYIRRLGFHLDWEHRFDEGFPVFLQISKFGLTIYLSEHSGDCSVGALVYLYVDDVDTWYSHCMSQGIVSAHAPEDQPWGNREFRIADPDGNQICIATRLIRS